HATEARVDRVLPRDVVAERRRCDRQRTQQRERQTLHYGEVRRAVALLLRARLRDRRWRGRRALVRGRVRLRDGRRRRGRSLVRRRRRLGHGCGRFDARGLHRGTVTRRSVERPERPCRVAPEWADEGAIVLVPELARAVVELELFQRREGPVALLDEREAALLVRRRR